VTPNKPLEDNGGIAGSLDGRLSAHALELSPPCLSSVFCAFLMSRIAISHPRRIRNPEIAVRSFSSGIALAYCFSVIGQTDFGHGHAGAEPGAAHNEGRAVLVDDLVVGLAALMCELGRSAEEAP
jgi:hypothetical protein